LIDKHKEACLNSTHVSGDPNAAWFASSMAGLFEQKVSHPPHFAGQKPCSKLLTIWDCRGVGVIR
jgi:hypothetical protein